MASPLSLLIKSKIDSSAAAIASLEEQIKALSPKIKSAITVKLNIDPKDIELINGQLREVKKRTNSNEQIKFGSLTEASNEMKRMISDMDRIREHFKSLGSNVQVKQVFDEAGNALKKFEVSVDTLNGKLKETQRFNVSANKNKDGDTEYSFTRVTMQSKEVAEAKKKETQASKEKSEANVKELSSIDKLILRYKAGQVALKDFIEYSKNIKNADNFGTKSLEQQAKLVQALETAQTKLKRIERENTPKDTSTSLPKITQELSSIDKLILRYKSVNISRQEFIEYGNRIATSDNFRNKSLEQQAKLLQALTSAERENVKQAKETSQINATNQANQARLYNTGISRPDLNRNNFASAENFSNYVRNLPQATAEVVKFNQRMSNTGEILTVATHRIREQGDKWRTYQTTVNHATGEIRELDRGLTNANNRQLSFANALQTAAQKMVIWLGVGNLIFGAIRNFKEGINYIIEMDAALTDLSKVTNLTTNELNQMKDAAVNMGKELGRSSVEIMKSMAEFGRVVKDMESIKQLTEVAVMSSNVTTMSADTAAKALNTTMISFKKNTSEAMHILDSFNEIQNNFRVSAEDLSDSIGKVGAAAKQAGISMEQLEGYTTAIVSASGIEGSEAGTALKSLISRMYRIGPEGEEDAGKAEEALTDIGIAVRKNATEFRDFDNILVDIKGKWDTLTSIQKSNIAQTIAGTYHYSKFINLMENFSIATAATDKALNSEGSALKENEKYLNSIQGKLSLLKTAFEDMYSKAFDSNVFKSIISTTTTLVKTFGNLPSAIFLATTALVMFKGKAIIAGIESIVGYTTSLYSLAVAEGVVATATTEAAVAFNSLKLAFMTNPIGIVAVAITTLIGLFAVFSNSAEDLSASLNKVNEEIETIKNNQDTLKTLGATYAELSKQTSLSSDEHQKMLDIQNQIADIAPELVKSYDSEGNAIIKNKEELDDYIKSMEKAKILRQAEKRDVLAKQLDQQQSNVSEADDWIKRREELNNIITKTKPNKNGLYTVPNRDGLGEQYFPKEQIQEQIDFITTHNIEPIQRDIRELHDSMTKTKKEIRDGVEEFASLSGISQKIAENLGSKIDYSNLNEYVKKIQELGIKINSKDLNNQISLYEKLTEQYQSGTITIDELVGKYNELKGILTQVGVTEKDISKFLTSPQEVKNTPFHSIAEDVKEFEKAVDSADKAFKEAVDHAQTLTSAQSELAENNKISSKTLEQLLLAYPQLIQYMDDETKLSKEIDNLLNDEVENQKKLYTAKIDLSKDFFNIYIKGNKETWDIVSKAYENDAKNFQTVADAKGEINKKLIEYIGGSWNDLYKDQGEALDASLKSMENSLPYVTDTIARQKLMQQMADIKQQKQVFDALNKPIDLTLDKIDFKTLNTDDKSTEKKDPPDKVLDPLKLEIDLYTKLNAEVDRATNALEKLKAQEDLVTGKEKIALLEKEIVAYKNLDKAKENVLKQQKDEREDLRKRMEKQNFKFEGDKDSINLATNYVTRLKQMVDAYNKMASGTEQADKDKAKASNEIENMKKFYARILELNKDTFATEKDRAEISKSINGIKADEIKIQQEMQKKMQDDLKKNAEDKIKIYEDAQQQIVDLLKDQKDKEKKALEESQKDYKEYIDGKIKDLDRLKAEQDFSKDVDEISKKIIEKQTDINKYQLAALSGDKSAIAKINELNKDKAELEKNLAEKQTDRTYELTKQSYQDQGDLYDKLIDDKKEEIDKFVDEANLKIEAEKILTKGTLKEITKSVTDLFEVTGTNATKAGEIVQNSLLSKLSAIKDIHAELEKLKNTASNNGVRDSDMVSVYGKGGTTPYFESVASVEARQKARFDKTTDVIMKNKIREETELATNRPAPFAREGYTGTWSGGHGRLAEVHPDEFILNKSTVGNMLQGNLQSILPRIGINTPRYEPIINGGNISVNFGSLLSVGNLSNIDTSKLKGMAREAANEAVNIIHAKLGGRGQFRK